MAEEGERRRRRRRCRWSMIRAARSTSKMSKTTETVLIYTTLMILVMVHIAMIAIGTVYLKDCSIQPKIPVYLVIAGALGLVLFGGIWCFITYCDHVGKTAPIWLQVFKAIVTTAYLCTLITGCLYVYNVPNKFQHTPFCKHELYRFADWVVTFSLVILILLSILYFVHCICFTIDKQRRKKAARESQVANENQTTNENQETNKTQETKF